MIKVENVETWGFEHAIRGMRNPLNSWDKSDSKMMVYHETDPYSLEETEWKEFVIGENDISLMKKLYNAGPEHRKVLRQIFVSMDITAPLYWWKEFDTYKVGTVANSCSTMHTLHLKEFTEEDFSFEEVKENADQVLIKHIIAHLNDQRELYLETRHKKHWYTMVQLLPSSFNQKRTVTMNYENVVNILHQRKNHKLKEWFSFNDKLLALPYVKELIK